MKTLREHIFEIHCKAGCDSLVLEIGFVIRQFRFVFVACIEVIWSFAIRFYFILPRLKAWVCYRSLLQ